MVQYPTTQVVDGITNKSIDIPKCIQLDDNRFYCFDYRGRLVSVQNTDIINLSTTPIATRPTATSISRITSPTGNLLLDVGLVFIINNPSLESNNGIFINQSIQWQGWTSLSIYSGSPTPGTGGAYGSAVTLFSNTNQNPRTMFVPLFLSITWGGTFASGETVSVEVNFTIVYGTVIQTTLGTGTLTTSATSTGTQNFGCAQIYAVIAPYLISIARVHHLISPAKPRQLVKNHTCTLTVTIVMPSLGLLTSVQPTHVWKPITVTVTVTEVLDALDAAAAVI